MSKKFYFLIVLTIVVISTVLLIVVLQKNESNELTFSELFLTPGDFKNETITVSGFFIGAFETSVLSEEIDIRGIKSAGVQAAGRRIWVEGGIPQGIRGELYQLGSVHQPVLFGKVKIRGKFQHGGKYGHLGMYDSQITLLEAKVLPWSLPEKNIVIRLPGGQAMLLAECADKKYIADISDYIIEANVVKIESKLLNQEEGMVFTYIDLAVEEIVKGSDFSVGAIQIVIPGGEADGISLWVEDQPEFRENSRIRLYLQEEDGEFAIVCHLMGVEEI